jgi:hypothetical protein
MTFSRIKIVALCLAGVTVSSPLYSQSVGINGDGSSPRAGLLLDVKADANGADSSFVITNRGYVGIGTTTPSNLLHITGSSATIRLEDDDEAASYSLLDDTGPTQFKLNKVTLSGNSIIDLNPIPSNGTGIATVRLFRETNSSGGVYLDILQGDGTPNSNTRLRGNGDSYLNALLGNVGIGTTSAGAQLDVRDLDNIGTSANDTRDLFLLSGSLNGNTNNFRILNVTDGGASWTGTSLRLEDNVDGNAIQNIFMEFERNSGTIDNGILFGEGAVGSEQYWGGWDNGNFGIGTTFPQAKLDVFGNNGTIGGIVVRNNNGRAATRLPFTDGNNYITGDDQTGGGHTIFRSDDGSNYTEHMRITNSGNVAIGTNSPTSLLHIDGGNSANSARWVEQHTDTYYYGFYSNPVSTVSKGLTKSVRCIRRP